jgi:hypothetical protein
MRYLLRSAVIRLKRELDEPDPAAIFLLAMLGGAFGLGVLYIGQPFHSVAARAFTSTGQYHLWLFLLCGQTALWALMLIPLTASLSALAQFGNGQWARVLASMAAFALSLIAVLIAAYLIGRHMLMYPLPSHRAKLNVIIAAGSLVALAGAMAMVLVHARLRQLARMDLADETIRSTYLQSAE